jgi:hypothetical protein
MAKRYFQQIPINGGLNTRLQWNHLGAEDNTILSNWVPEEDGSLRIRTQINTPTQTGSAIPNGGTSVFYSGSEVANIKGVYVSKHDSADGFVKIHRADDEVTPDWGSAVIDSSTGSSTQSMPFVAGNGIILFGNSSYNTGKLRFWNGTTVADASSVVVAGRGLTYHKERFWTCGPAASEVRLYYSGIADHTSWSLNNYIDVGPNDGGVVEDILPANGGLMIAKSNSLWFLSGSGPSDFALTKIDKGEAAAGRCITVTNYGIVIAGSDHIWLWTGQGPAQSLTYNVDYNNVGVPVTCICVDDQVIVTSSITQIIYDMRTQKWRNQSNASTAADRTAATCLGGPELKTVISICKKGCNSALSGISTQVMTGETRIKDNANRGLIFQVSGGWFQLGDDAHKATLRHLHILVGQRETGTGTLNVAVYRATGLGSASSIASKGMSPEAAAGVYRYRLDADNQGTQDQFALIFTQIISTGSSDDVLWDILDAVVEYDLEEVR